MTASCNKGENQVYSNVGMPGIHHTSILAQGDPSVERLRAKFCTCPEDNFQ